MILITFRVAKEEVVDDWAERFTIPTRFSAETLTAIKSGIPTNRARNEIVNSLATLILVHTNRPTPDDFTSVCQKLVTKYPTLKDKVDSGYVNLCMFILLSSSYC